MALNYRPSLILVLLSLLAVTGLACNFTSHLSSVADVSPTVPPILASPTLSSPTAIPPTALPVIMTATPAGEAVAMLPSPTNTVLPATATATVTPSITPTATNTPLPSPTPRPTFPPIQPTGFNAVAPAGVTGVEARLWSLSIIPTFSPRLYQIFEAGQSMGNRAAVFSKVGDCHTASYNFMLPLGVNEYDLGPYDFLQVDVDYFSAVSPRQGVPNSFENQSMAAASAFNAGAVLDSIWSDPTHCEDEESPLACEYRLVRPSVALITLGSVDVQIYPVEQFEIYLDELVETTIAHGIIPVLLTFPTHPDYFYQESLAFNTVIMDIAAREQIPLINFWRASRELPNYGLEGDNFHLSHAEDRFVTFNGQERQYGAALHNLLAMLTLDSLRQNVLVW